MALTDLKRGGLGVVGDFGALGAERRRGSARRSIGLRLLDPAVALLRVASILRHGS